MADNKCEDCSHDDTVDIPDDHPAKGLGDDYDPNVMKEKFDEWSKTYDQDIEKWNYNGPKRVAESMSKIIPDKSATILDLGCCTGLVGEELSKVGFHNVDGVDISDECIKLAKGKNIYRNILNEDLSPDKTLSFGTGSYDAVILVGAGMFLDIHGMKEWLRITKTDGYTVIGVMESETTSDSVKPVVDEYLSQGLMEKVHEDIVEDYFQGKSGSIVYFRPSRK
ncbi:uncharacterized protein [Ptychodera flava]|uniref:uncharacterized protein n=1 Tax=Ptychodera flava TaxID=63121 RepID=UPI00396A9009